MHNWFGYLQLILQGAGITAALTLVGCLIAFPLAFVAGLARISRFVAVRVAASVYIEFFRGTSIFVQLFWVFFVLPLVGIALSPFVAGATVLGLNVGAYAAEVVRGAVIGVPRAQREACVALNLSRSQALRHVILPQAFVVMLPTFGNNAIELLKATAVVSVISLADLTFEAQLVRNQTGSTAVPFLAILLIYFGFAMVLSACFRTLERRLVRGLDGVR